MAEENRVLFRAHPWAAQISAGRPSSGPGSIARYEHELASFDDLELDDVEVDDCLAHLLTFVQASARSAQDALDAQRDSSMDDGEWWTAAGPQLARLLDVDAHPRAVRIGSTAGAAHGSAADPDDPEHAYRFGLQRVLDGLAVLIERRDTFDEVGRTRPSTGDPDGVT